MKNHKIPLTTVVSFKILGEAGLHWLTKVFNKIIVTRKIPKEWRRSILVPIYKNKVDFQSCNNYREIKLMSHTMKLWKRVIEHCWLSKYKDKGSKIFLDCEDNFIEQPSIYLYSIIKTKL